eukprot:scaffold1707_cov357-Prasinococcus_capsulatus_cf.AAC.9
MHSLGVYTTDVATDAQPPAMQCPIAVMFCPPFFSSDATKGDVQHSQSPWSSCALLHRLGTPFIAPGTRERIVPWEGGASCAL